MIKKIINNFLEVIKALLKNKVVIVFVLSLIGVTNAGQYFFIPPHLHYKQPKTIVVNEPIHKTIINKSGCDAKCQADIQKLIRLAISKHVKIDH